MTSFTKQRFPKMSAETGDGYENGAPYCHKPEQQAISDLVIGIQNMQLFFLIPSGISGQARILKHVRTRCPTRQPARRRRYYNFLLTSKRRRSRTSTGSQESS